MQQPKAWPGFETTHHHTAPQAPPMWRAPAGPEGLAAVPVGGGRARAGLEIDHSEPQARVWRSRGRPGPTAPGTPAMPHSDNMQRGRLAGGPPPTGAQSSPAKQGTPSSPAQQAAGCAKGAGTEVPAPCRLTQPLPRRGSGRMILSPGDGDASTGTCRPRRPLPGPLRRSGRRSRCARGPSSAWWPGRRARRNRSSRR